jgi:nucleotide-binding universal stress UspA family protein
MDVAVTLSGAPSDRDLLQAADLLAHAIGARLSGVFPVALPSRAASPPVANAPSVEEARDRQWEESTDHLEALQGTMTFQSALNDFSILERPSRSLLVDTVAYLRGARVLVASVPSLEWATPFQQDLFARMMVDSGRPVLVLPKQAQLERVPATIMVALGNSPQGARALSDAMPLLRRARNVYVVTVGHRKDADGVPANPDPRRLLRDHLDRHGVNARVRTIEPSELAIGDALIREAGELGAELIVAGAFGHSKLREFVFGSTTLALLEQATTPLLMAH